MKSVRFILGLFLCGLFTVPTYAATERDSMIDAQVFAPVASDSSTSDGKAVVYALEGKAMLTPKGSPVERALQVGDTLQAGDAVYTEKGASLSISFDRKRDNAIRIPADSKAIFTSIEPTDIKLENGAIFSVVNGLAKGSTWKVTTPSAVAAVRGTIFIVRYESATGQMYAATVNVPDDGKTSAIEIRSLTSDGTAEVVEGREISMKEGEAPTSEMVQDLSLGAVAEIQQFFQEIAAEQEKSSDDKSKGTGGPGGPGGPNSGTGPGNGTGQGAGGPNGSNSASPMSTTGQLPLGMPTAGFIPNTGTTFVPPPSDPPIAPPPDFNFTTQPMTDTFIEPIYGLMATDYNTTLPPLPPVYDPLVGNPATGASGYLPPGCTSLPCDLIPDCQSTNSCISYQTVGTDVNTGGNTDGSNVG